MNTNLPSLTMHCRILIRTELFRIFWHLIIECMTHSTLLQSPALTFKEMIMGFLSAISSMSSIIGIIGSLFGGGQSAGAGGAGSAGGANSKASEAGKKAERDVDAASAESIRHNAQTQIQSLRDGATINALNAAAKTAGKFQIS
jgi:hypothetical protein